MLELLNIKFSYFLRSSYQNGEGQLPIVLRVIYRNERRDMFTGLYCLASEWDNKKGSMKGSAKPAIAMKQNLDLIIHKAHEVFENLKFTGAPFSMDDLVNRIKGKEDLPTSLLEFIEQSNEGLKKRINVDLTRATFFKYRRTLQHLLEFVQTEHRVKTVLLNAINRSFLEKYLFHLRTVKKISHNTSVKYMKFLRTVLLPAIRAGQITNDPFVGLKLKYKEMHREYLTGEEITRIVNLELDNASLMRVRDIFLFACLTGLAYVDLRYLSRLNIIQDADGSWYIRKPRQKTGQESIIPLLPPAIRIMEKNSLTGDIRDLKWRITSNQKMNFQLKVIGEKAGIEKALHMHLARHTFATTVTLSNGVPIETVSRMLGHANLRQTQHYAKIVAEKVKKDMFKLKELYQ